MASPSTSPPVNPPLVHSPEIAGIKSRVDTAARRLISFCATHPLWVVCMSVVVLVWTVELYTVQAKTLIYPNEVGARFAWFAPKARLVLDVLFLSTMVMATMSISSFAWRWLSALAIGAFFVDLTLITYFQYFQRPLAIFTVFANWREGVEVGGFAWELIPKNAALVLGVTLAIKLLALFLSRQAALPRSSARLVTVVLALSYVLLYAGVNQWDPLYKILTTRGVGRLGVARGYLGPWAAEWFYLGSKEVTNGVLELRKIKYDRLAPLEAEIPIHQRLVIIQAESLDFNILGHEVDGQPVTPFLNHLRDVSMFYRVKAMHFNGSSDADFAALNAVSGSRHENTYMISGYPYQNTTPQVLNRSGFATSSFHGHSGEFYRRRTAFEKMGFKEIYFREELEGRYGMKTDRWGVSDRDVLNFSSHKMREADGPACHFIITLTTHTPYTMLPASEWQIYPHPRNAVQHYMNNMRYLDNCLRDYITSLGSGTTIMLYADHPTEVSSADGSFAPDRVDGREFIPCFIYDAERDLAKLQKTRKNPISKDGTLNLVDMINYFRTQVQREYPPEAVATAGKGTSEPVANPAPAASP